MPDYLINAVDCPAIPVETTALVPGTELPVKAQQLPVSPGVVVFAQPWNINAAHLDNLGRFGGSPVHCVALGLDLTAGTGLTLNISAGVALIGGVPTVLPASTKALSNADNYIWALRGGTIAAPQLNTVAPPAGAVAYLGMVPASGGVQGTPDYSGRTELRGNGLYRRTGDAGAPGDTPPAGLMIFTRTAGGYYLWTGDEYLAVPDLDAAQTWASKQTFSGEIEIDGALNHDGTTAGFFGVAPVTRPTALTAADAGTINSGDATTDGVIGNLRTRLAELEAKFQALGLLQ